MSNQILTTTTSINLSGKIVSDSHFVLLVDCSLSDVTVSLPDANAVKNICLVIIKKDDSTNSVTINAFHGQNIDNKSAVILSNENQGIQLFAHKSNYYSGDPGPGIATGATGLPVANTYADYVYLTTNFTNILFVDDTVTDKRAAVKFVDSAGSVYTVPMYNPLET